MSLLHAHNHFCNKFVHLGLQWCFFLIYINIYILLPITPRPLTIGKTQTGFNNLLSLLRQYISHCAELRKNRPEATTQASDSTCVERETNLSLQERMGALCCHSEGREGFGAFRTLCHYPESYWTLSQECSSATVCATHNVQSAFSSRCGTKHHSPIK